MRTSTLLVLTLAACGSTATVAPSSKPGSRGPRADEHLDAARSHARRAAELSRWPEARHSETGRFDDPTTGLWYRSWDLARDHERLAEIHRGAAAEIHAHYDEACGTTPLQTVAISPLQRHGLGGMPTSDGATLFLGPEAGPPEKLMADIRCHQAWMMLGESGMDYCPLDLHGVRVQAYGDDTGITVELTVEDPALLPELKRRAAADLEGAARRRATTTPSEIR